MEVKGKHKTMLAFLICFTCSEIFGSYDRFKTAPFPEYGNGGMFFVVLEIIGAILGGSVCIRKESIIS